MNKKITYFIVLLYIMSCNTVRKNNQSNDFKHIWMMIEFQNYSKSDLVSKKAFLDLTNENASAKMGCNNLSFNMDLKNTNTISFTNLVATRMACDEMNLEGDFLKQLPQITTYTIYNHQLTLSNSKGVRMVFVAQDWD